MLLRCVIHMRSTCQPVTTVVPTYNTYIIMHAYTGNMATMSAMPLECQAKSASTRKGLPRALCGCGRAHDMQGQHQHQTMHNTSQRLKYVDMANSLNSFKTSAGLASRMHHLQYSRSLRRTSANVLPMRSPRLNRLAG